MKSLDVYKLLRDKFSAPEWVFIREVPASTGGGYRRADGIAMNLWKSRGMELNGFEVKVDRGDWKNELAKPEKADPICQYCDRWWIVVGNEDIVREGELPPTWGLIVPRQSSLVVKIPAPKLEPKALSRDFVASLLRKASEQSLEVEDKKAEFLRGYAEGQVAAEKSAKEARGTLAVLQGRIAEFEKASGMSLTPWTGPQNIGNVVRAILDSKVPIGAMERCLRRVDTFANEMKETIKLLREEQLLSSPNLSEF